MKHYLRNLSRLELHQSTGKVLQYVGLVIEASGPDVNIGDICEVIPSSGGEAIYSEVVGFKDGRVLLMPFGKVRGISLGSEVKATGHSATVPVSNGLLGRVVDAFARPLDDKGKIPEEARYSLYKENINPLHRERISKHLKTGVKGIDLFTPVGQGQKLGIFSGSGVGKSTLIGSVAKNIDSDVNVVALIGERGREVNEFISEILGDEGLKKSVVIVATAEQPALVRTHAVYSAMAIAEFFCDQGKNVVFTLDSITRFALAQREIGLAIGEPPTTRGYTPSVFSSLSPIAERCGNFIGKGSITGLLTVLVEGDDLNEPVADYMRGILDGHIVLSRKLANKSIYPAIDLLKSQSRLIGQLVDTEMRLRLNQVLKLLDTYETSSDLVELGAYKVGSNPMLDKAIPFYPKLIALLSQGEREVAEYQNVVRALNELVETIDNV